ncbi:ornithine cyclodeaminase family protein [Compostimonas suwonensis]|uniref:Ornithine cyclodeaminase n=1 Tax=Compostimonas suwonensis TaxID=1048394 RepID=A0A2M9BZW2_9MICO|nr:NAD(P)-binding domain-containing protein [Compostimonas suwonensis]PJJ63604.1 ornithine cyclodeaminase [Compostimonas suwonensis]
MLLIDATEVERLYGMSQAFESVAEAAIAQTRGTTDVPARAGFRVPGADAEVLVMPGVVDGTTFGSKIWYSSGGDSLPSSAALIVLVDPELGEVVMDGSVITDLRTGAMTGLAAARLAPPATSVAAIIGAGAQARTQALALVHALDTLTTIRIASRNPDRRNDFASALRREISIAHPSRDVEVIAVDSVRSACAGAGVVVAATTSATPVIMDDWIGPDVLVCGVGSHTPDAAEIEMPIVARAKRVVVDTVVGALHAADITAALESGSLARTSIIELGELLQEPAGTGAGGINVFKSVGFAAADIYSARSVARAAVARGTRTFDIHG